MPGATQFLTVSLRSCSPVVRAERLGLTPSIGRPSRHLSEWEYYVRGREIIV